MHAHTHMLEPTPFCTPLLTPGSPDPPTLPTAPRGVTTGWGSHLHPPQQHGQRWGVLGQVSSPRGPPGRGLHPGGGSARPRLGPRWLALGLVWAVSQHEAAPGAGVHSPLSRKVPRPRHRPGSDGSAGLLPRDQRRGARRARCLWRPVPQQSVLITPRGSQSFFLHKASWLGAEDLASISTSLLQHMQKC